MTMNQILFKIVMLSLATAAISLTISKARVFTSLRKQIGESNKWLGELISCTYCTSHWVAFALVAMCHPVIVSQKFMVDLLVTTFVLVALSAIVIGAIMKLMPVSSPKVSETEEELKKLRMVLSMARDKIREQERIIQEKG